MLDRQPRSVEVLFAQFEQAQPQIRDDGPAKPRRVQRQALADAGGTPIGAMWRRSVVAGIGRGRPSQKC
jgi:hypothetical protein